MHVGKFGRTTIAVRENVRPFRRPPRWTAPCPRVRLEKRIDRGKQFAGKSFFHGVPAAPLVGRGAKMYEDRTSGVRVA